MVYYTLVRRMANVSQEELAKLLVEAIAAKNIDKATELIPQIRNLDQIVGNNTALTLACEKGLLPIVNRLLDNGASLDFQVRNGTNALMVACCNKARLNIVKLLLDRGAHIDLQSKNGRTPLLLSLAYHSDNIAKLLIERGALLDVQDKDGVTALIQAADNGKLDLVKLLLERGANMDIQDSISGSTALMASIMSRYPKITELLVKSGASINHQNRDGYTALFLTCIYQDLYLIKLLLDNGASLTIRDNRGHTVLEWASRRGPKKIVDFIQRYATVVPKVKNFQGMRTLRKTFDTGIPVPEDAETVISSFLTGYPGTLERQRAMLARNMGQTVPIPTHGPPPPEEEEEGEEEEGEEGTRGGRRTKRRARRSKKTRRHSFRLLTQSNTLVRQVRKSLSKRYPESYVRNLGAINVQLGLCRG